MKSPPLKPVIILPTGTKQKTILELTAAGYVPIVCDSPDRILVIQSGTKVPGDDFLMAALHGACSGVSAKCDFSDELLRRLRNNEAANKPKPPQ